MLLTRDSVKKVFQSKRFLECVVLIGQRGRQEMENFGICFRILISVMVFFFVDLTYRWNSLSSHCFLTLDVSSFTANIPLNLFCLTCSYLRKNRVKTRLRLEVRTR